MSKTAMWLALAVLLDAPAVTHAQVNVQVQIGLPTIRFESRPALVTVSEGVEVVPDYQEEVFFRDGWYWHRSGTRWYRMRDYRGGWVLVERRYVPVVLVGIPPGKYKYHKVKGPKGPPPAKFYGSPGPGNGPGPGHGRGNGNGNGKHKRK
jgi:hypothetical protein